MKAPFFIQVINSHCLVEILPFILLGACAYDANRCSLEDVTPNLTLSVVAPLGDNEQVDIVGPSCWVFWRILLGLIVVLVAIEFLALYIVSFA